MELFGRNRRTNIPPPPKPEDARSIERGLMSVSDPALARYFGISDNLTGTYVSESSALGIPGVFRAVTLIAETVAALDLRTVVKNGDLREIAPSWLDDPAQGLADITEYEWKESLMMNLLIHGNAFFLKATNGAGMVGALIPLHPSKVTIEIKNNEKIFHVTTDSGVDRVTDREILHIPGINTDGFVGYSPISLHRATLGAQIAMDKAAASFYGNGLHLSGLIHSDDDISQPEADALMKDLRDSAFGWEKSGSFIFANKRLTFSPLNMTAADAQYLESRKFGLQEIANIFGIPHYMLDPEKQSSWGTGIEAQQRGLARQVILPWSKRIEARLSRLLPDGMNVEFDFKSLEQGTPEQEINLLVAQVNSGILTANEARAILNRSPLEQEEQPNVSDQ